MMGLDSFEDREHDGEDDEESSGWKDVETLGTAKREGKVTVLKGRVESSINGRVANIVSFDRVPGRATFYYNDVKGRPFNKVPTITRLEKSPNGSYRFHLSEGVWLFEPSVRD